MNPFRKSPAGVLPLLAAMILLLPANSADQAQVILTPGAESTFAADWQGLAGHTYFLQWSLDLQTWRYAPFVDFGEGMHSRGLDGTPEKAFFRLVHEYKPNITTLEQAQNADFDNDGLSNLFEVTFGFDPYVANSTGSGLDGAQDSDGDGMTNSTESTNGRNPTLKDNPKLQLQVTAG